MKRGGPNSSRYKIAYLRRPPLTLRPFASLRVQAAQAGLLSAAPRDTSWRWASGPRRKTRRIFDNGHEPLQARPQARNPHPRHLRDRRPALPPPGRRGKRRPGLRPHRPEYDAIRTEHATAVKRMAEAFEDSLNDKATAMHFQRIVGALVACAVGAGRFYSEKVTPAGDAPVRAADGGDDEHGTPIGLES